MDISTMTKQDTCIGIMLQKKAGAEWFDALAQMTGLINQEMLDRGKQCIAGEPYMTITMPCGEMLAFKREPNIYALVEGQDIPCSCGDTHHYFIKWSEWKGDNDGKGKEDQEAKASATGGRDTGRGWGPPGNGI